MTSMKLIPESDLIEIAKAESHQWFIEPDGVNGGCRFTWAQYFEAARRIESLTKESIQPTEQTTRIKLAQIDSIDDAASKLTAVLRSLLKEGDMSVMDFISQIVDVRNQLTKVVNSIKKQ